MSNPLMTRARIAEAAILANRIVKPGATDDAVLQGTATSDLLIGVVEGVSPALGERCDVVMVGIAEVKLGGTVARGASITSDSTGQGVAAAATNRAIGHALASGVSGDVIEVLLAPHTV